MSGASVDFHAFPTVPASLGVPAAGLPGVRRGHREALGSAMHRPAHPPRPGSTTLYEEVALTALASVDGEQVREFVTAEPGPLTATDDDTVRLSTTFRVYLEENMSLLRASQRLGVHENTITNRIRAAPEPPAHPVEHRSCELRWRCG